MLGVAAQTRRRRRFMPKARSIVLFLLAGLLIAVVTFPMAWALSSSFKDFQEIYQNPLSIIPDRPVASNFLFLFEKLPYFPRQVVNSFIVTVSTVILTALLATMMGYGFARIDFRGRDLLFYLVIISMFVPQSGGLMAQYELMDYLHLRDSLLGLVLAFASGLPVSMFIMRQTFLYIPRELEDAAQIDGCSTWRVFWHVALPMCTSGLIVVTILKFVQVWGDYLFTLTMLDSEEKFTAAVGVAIVRSFIGFRTGATTTTAEAPIAPLGVLAASSVVVMAPVIIVYIALQKWFVRGLTEGVLKF